MMWQFTYTQTPKHQHFVWLGVVLLHVVGLSALLRSTPSDNARVVPNNVTLEMVMAPAVQKTSQVAEKSPTHATAPKTSATTATPHEASAETSHPRATPSAASPTSPAVSWPNAHAPGLNNPAPSYPKLSRRLNEQGQVMIRVYVGVDGSAQQADIKTSSGYDRLDQEALRTVMRWRFVPGQHLGVPEAMWFNVPVNFVLD